MTTYNTGTVALTAGSATVTGTGTAFTAAMVGALFQRLDGTETVLYRVATVPNGTTITLDRNWAGGTASGAAYQILLQDGVKLSLANAVSTLVTGFQTIAANAGAGRFAKGTASNPSLRGLEDPDSGVNFEGGNIIDWFTAAVRRMRLTTTALQVDVPITGTAAQANAWDATAGRLLKTGAANLLLNDTSGATVLEATGTDSVDACRLSGLWRYTSGTTGRPTGSIAGMVLHIVRLGGQDNGRHQQIAFPSEGGVLYRGMTNTSGNWSAWQPFLFAGALASVSAVDMGGARHGGVQVTIADDAVYTFTPARKGGLIYIGSQTNTDFPALGDCALFQYDVGNSIQAAPISIGVGVDVLTTGVDLTATPGADGRITVSLRSNGTLQFNNRTGGSRALSIHTLS